MARSGGLFVAALVFASARSTLPSTGQDLALTPPMGWNSWNPFGKNVSESVIRETADAIVTSGLKEVGFSYVVIDDMWQGGRVHGQEGVGTGPEENSGGL